MTTAELRAVQGRLHSTETFGAVDGPGIRFVAFLQGCPLRCLYCHNPDAIDGTGGTAWTAGELADEILRYRLFIKGGVTFSGGEPLRQAELVTACARLLKAEGLHVAIDTSGSEPPARPAVRMAIEVADLLLLDIKAAREDMAVALTGRGLTNALATLELCRELGKPVWARQVLVRGYTLEEGQLHALAAQLGPYAEIIQRLELLPFHKMGEHKWAALRTPYALGDTPATTREEVAWAAELLSEAGLKIPVVYSQ